MSALPDLPTDRVAVRLKTLLDLAQPAALLKPGASAIRAALDGDLVSRIKGRGMAFDESRLYQPGDDVRCMDWKVTARTGKPHSKVFKEEKERPVFIAVDARRTMSFATRGVFKSVQAAKLAALLAWAAQQQGDRIGGQIFADHGCLELKPHSGKHAVLRLFNALLNPLPDRGEPLALSDVLARLVRHARPGSRVYLISDFRGLDDGAERHLAKLASHCDVILIQVFDPLENHLPTRGRYRLTDTIRELTVDSGDRDRLTRYHQRFQQRQAQLQRLSRTWRLRFLSCATADDPVATLTGRL